MASLAMRLSSTAVVLCFGFSAHALAQVDGGEVNPIGNPVAANRAQTFDGAFRVAPPLPPPPPAPAPSASDDADDVVTITAPPGATYVLFTGPHSVAPGTILAAGLVPADGDVHIPLRRTNAPFAALDPRVIVFARDPTAD